MKEVYIGIDPGVQTGIAIWNANSEEYESIQSVTILEAMEIITEQYHRIIEVVIEDARKWKHGTKSERAQGAGSVKRDCKIWEEFCKQYEVPHRFVMPNNRITKLNAKVFQQITKHKGSTASHGRDAAMLVYKMQLV